MIKLICIGKIKEKFIQDAILEYTKRLTKYTNFKIIELPDISIGNEDIIKQKEAELILSNIKDNEYVITLEIEGKEYNSIEFSDMIDKQLVINSNLTFIIGGSYGLHFSVINRSNNHISFSRLTFPHQLFRLIFIEQLYRAFKIVNHETYHK
jgi:23S rRNA (pseudouridine1915-N3)-methyltransferase